VVRFKYAHERGAVGLPRWPIPYDPKEKLLMVRGLLAALLAISLAGCVSGAAKPTKTPAEEKAQATATLIAEGRGYAEAGDALRAEQYFAAALNAGADEKVVLPLFLRACIADKNYRLAIEYAEAALAREPKNAHLRLLSGTLHASIGDTARSRERLERAASELPNEAEVQFTVAVSFRDDAGDVVMADRYFRRYLALAPNGAHAEEAKSSLMEQIQ
jgi:Tfp pilus assembly protein PilF